MLAVVPARGGSKGVLNKNLRIVAGKPLILHILGTLRQVNEITEIVVSTECDTIATIARLHGYRVVQRPSALAEDDVPIGPVIADAAEQLRYAGPVGIFQPTSPCLSADTIRAGIAMFVGTECDSLGFVAADGHLMWGTDGPLYSHRVNRQQRSQYRELGAFLSAKIPASDFDPIVGDRHVRFEVPAREAYDIDTPADLEGARQVLSRKMVEFRAVASDSIGSGHIRRCLQLAEELSHHEVMFRRPPEGLPRWAMDQIIERGWLALPPHAADLVVIDKLDTTARQVCELKSWGATVVTLEDLGEGSRFADLVINELYDDRRPNVLSGPAWSVLRPEFCGLPRFPIADQGSTVLVTFGGTDPSGLLERVAPIVAWQARCRVLLPPQGASGARPSLPGALMEAGCELVTGSVAAAMRSVDLVVTSAGRTAHEAAACGVPVMTIAANERESRHSHCPGVLRLGLGATLGDDVIAEAVGRVLASAGLRTEMSETARAAVDGLGARRIVQRIESLLERL